MTMEIQHIDTCLSCYVLDHCNGDNELLLGVYVSSASRVYDVKREAHEELERSDCDKPGFDYDAAHAAIDVAFAGVHPFKTWDTMIESDPDDVGESVYSWFRLSWGDYCAAARGE